MTAPYIDPRLVLAMRGMRSPTPAQSGLLAASQPPQGPSPNIWDRAFGTPGVQGLISPEALKSSRRAGLLSAGVAMLANADRPFGQALQAGLQAGQQGYQGQVGGALQATELERQRAGQAAMQQYGQRIAQAAGDPTQLMQIAQEALGAGMQTGNNALIQSAANIIQQMIASSGRQQAPIRGVPVEVLVDGKPHIQMVNPVTGEDIGKPRPSYVKPTTSGADEPKQYQVESAKFTAEMARADTGMRALERSHPSAVSEVANLAAAGSVAGTLPIIGPTLEAAIKAGRAPNLSQEAQQYLAHLNSFINAAIPERGGKQLTITELRQYLQTYVPDPGEGPEARQIKVGNRELRVQNGISAAGPAWRSFQGNVNWSPSSLDQPQAPASRNPFAGKNPWE